MGVSKHKGRYFEEFDIGDTFETLTRTITESDIMRFAGLSGDYNQLHTDVEFAKETRYGERIAHGLLGLSIVSGLANRLGFSGGTTEALTGVDWKFRKPIRIGDTICAIFEVIRKKKISRMGGGFVILKVLVLNQKDEIIQKGTWTALVKINS